MGTANEHKEKAAHHLKFLGTITDEYPDWLTTVAFYAAAEFIEALFAERGLHSERHEHRNQGVERNFPSIAKPYKALYNASLNVRYLPSHRWPALEDVKRELIAKSLHHIKSFAESHFQDSQGG